MQAPYRLTYEDAVDVWLRYWGGEFQHHIAASYAVNQGRINEVLRMRRRPPSTGFIEPCLPSNAPRPPAGDQWLHEVKQDGFRLMARRDAAGVRQQPLTRRLRRASR